MNAQEQLPLTESTFLIILSMAPSPKHGYAIMKEVEALSDGRVVLSTGTLYGALKRMLEGGWSERVDDPEPNGSDRERKAYQLTKLGRRILEAESARLRKLADMAMLQTEGRGI
jgi:DNA-binding PadR family transcriptional regulator